MGLLLSMSYYGNFYAVDISFYVWNRSKNDLENCKSDTLTSKDKTRLPKALFVICGLALGTVQAKIQEMVQTLDREEQKI